VWSDEKKGVRPHFPVEKMGSDPFFFASPFLLLALVLLLHGCGTHAPKPPKVVDPFKGGISAADLPDDWDLKDGTPPRQLDPNKIADAVPRRDVITIAGNKSPYEVLGETYRVMPNARGFTQRGMGSWYGTKFHGRKTSNGEDYDVYAMSAAHKTLPIPCYVRVTNLENGRRAVVRVNDRGPFLHDRIIDLSYAAATKLGYAAKGTAYLEIAYIDTNNSNTANLNAAFAQVSAPPPTRPPEPYQALKGPRQYLQVGAFGSYEAARQLAERLQKLLNRPVFVNTDKPELYRVHVGPIPAPQVEEVRAQLAAAHIANVVPVHP